MGTAPRDLEAIGGPWPAHMGAPVFLLTLTDRPRFYLQVSAQDGAVAT